MGILHGTMEILGGTMEILRPLFSIELCPSYQQKNLKCKNQDKVS